MVSSVTLLALASSALALRVTSPEANTVWSTGGKQTIKWESVSSDQPIFNIYLSNKASFPPTDVLLASDVKTSSGSVEVDGSKLSAGNSYTINLTNGTKTEQLYAQSNQFNITQGSASSASSTTSGSLSTTSSGASATRTDSSATASSAASGSATAAASSTGASSAGSSATSTGASASATASKVPSGAGKKTVASFVGVAALAILAL